MKFIKYAVGLVIALSIIPLVVVTVNNLEAPRLKTIEFEVIDYNEGIGTITFSDNTYNDINSLAILDINDDVSNLVVVIVNNIEVVEFGLSKDIINVEYSFGDVSSNFDWDGLNNTNIAGASGYNATINDKWTMTFEVPVTMPPLVKLLVGFAPLLLVGGILLFMLNKRKLD